MSSNFSRSSVHACRYVSCKLYSWNWIGSLNYNQIGTFTKQTTKQFTAHRCAHASHFVWLAPCVLTMLTSSTFDILLTYTMTSRIAGPSTKEKFEGINEKCSRDLFSCNHWPVSFKPDGRIRASYLPLSNIWSSICCFFARIFSRVSFALRKSTAKFQLDLISRRVIRWYFYSQRCTT